MTNESGEDRGEWPSPFPGRWGVVSFAESFDNVTSSSLKLAQKEYLEAGKHPVIDQGSEPVGGYTSNESLVHPGPLPAIIFGDHTRCVKFTERPFVQGADGVKVLAPRVFDPQFSFWALKTLKLPDRGYSRHFKFLKASRFPLPPLNEQRRIVAKIEDLTARSRAAKEALDAIPPLLERFRKSVLAAAFRGDLTKHWREQNPNVEPASVLLQRIRQERRQRWEQDYLDQQKAKGKTPKDDKWKEKYQEPEPVDTTGLPELPESWCWGSLDLLSEFVTDGDHNPPKRKPNGIPHLTARNVRYWAINYEKCTFISESDFEKVRKRYEPRPGDVLITCVGTVGETAIVPRGAVFSADRNLAAVRPLVGVSSEVLQFFLNSPTLQNRMQNSSGATAQPHLYLTQLRKFPVPLPPSEEQRALRDLAETRLQEISNLATAISQSKFLRNRLDQSILAKAFRGELVPQDPNDEPASELLARLREKNEGKVTPKRPKKTSRSTNMGKINAEVIRRAVLELSSDRFTFDELRAIVSGDYEELKSALFEVLEEKSPIAHQEFDEKKQAMHFVRLKK